MTDIAAERLRGDTASADNSPAGSLGRLPRRDLIILPLLSLATLAVLLVFSEFGARMYLPEAIDDVCRVHGAAPGETRNLPNCRTELKLPEGPMAVYSYNACGYRTDASCGPRPAGVNRLAIIGSSMAQGYGVAYEDVFATRTGHALEKLCGRPMQIENMGTVGNSVLGMHNEIGEALGLHPDAVVMVIAPFDIWSLSNLPPYDPNAPTPAKAPAAPEPQQGEPPNLLHQLEMDLKASRAVFLMQHLLFQNPSFYVKTYLLYGDKADFLRSPFSPAWEARLTEFEQLVSDMADKAHRAGVPFALMVGPQQAQAVLMSTKQVPAGVDPSAFGRRMAEIASRHGIVLINTTEAFAQVKRADQDFFTVDGHPDEKGNAVIADALVQGLVQGPAAPLAACSGSSRSAEK